MPISFFYGLCKIYFWPNFRIFFKGLHHQNLQKRAKKNSNFIYEHNSIVNLITNRTSCDICDLDNFLPILDQKTDSSELNAERKGHWVFSQCLVVAVQAAVSWFGWLAWLECQRLCHGHSLSVSLLVCLLICLFLGDPARRLNSRILRWPNRQVKIQGKEQGEKNVKQKKKKIEAKWTEWHGHETKLTLQTTPAAAAASENGKCQRYEPRENEAEKLINIKFKPKVKSSHQITYSEISKPQKTHLYFVFFFFLRKIEIPISHSVCSLINLRQQN